MVERHSLRCVVLTVSGSRTAADDSSGDLLVQRLQLAGHGLARRAIVTDNLYEIRRVLSDCIADREVQVVLPLLDRDVPGFGELMRQLSYADIGTSALQARSLAGFANGKLIFCLPGSTGACALAWDSILVEQLDSRHKPCNFASRLGVNG